MSDIKTQDFVALRTSCSIRRYCFEELAEKETREIFYEKVCKINIIFLTNVSILRILSLIPEQISQKMYLLLLQLSPWLRYIE